MATRIALFTPAFLLFCVGIATGGEYHGSAAIPCSDCHTMHYEGAPSSDLRGPFSRLLMRETANELCLGCHDGTDVSAPNVLDAASGLRGGWFDLHTGSQQGDGHSLGSAEPPPGHTGHRIVEPLLCTSCHDPHGNEYYRNLVPDPAGIGGFGLTYQMRSSTASGASVIVSGSPSVSRLSADGVLFASHLRTGTGAHMSEWCGACHGYLSGSEGDPHMGGAPVGYEGGESAWLQHPVKGIALTVSGASKDEALASLRGPMEVTCLTCHAAHGSGQPSSLIYDDPTTVLPRDGTRIGQTCEGCHRFDAAGFESGPHGDPESGVFRSSDCGERGECTQCHVMHGLSSEGHSPGVTFPHLLLAGYGNEFCYGNCHRDTPFGYPAQESDRMPEWTSRPGYFEHNNGGMKIPGVHNRTRWPGRSAFSSILTYASGRLYSPHAHDYDMPRRDPGGEGACQSCHDAHGSAERPDLLVSASGPIDGGADIGAPRAYSLCLSCHSMEGPVGMDPESRRIRDYYDPTINDDSGAGHQIRFNGQVALSWPSNVELGDKLPCYDCHNPHGSLGNDGANPNGYLISDQRPGWSGLTDPLTNAEQSRRFCLGCHIASDGMPGSRTVEGIVMNAISRRTGHSSLSTESCHSCHGDDYSTAVSYNAHHPAGGAIAVHREEHVR
jgi:predicted CXXCH cytochrome family protein